MLVEEIILYYDARSKKHQITPLQASQGTIFLNTHHSITFIS